MKKIQPTKLESYPWISMVQGYAAMRHKTAEGAVARAERLVSEAAAHGIHLYGNFFRADHKSEAQA